MYTKSLYTKRYWKQNIYFYTENLEKCLAIKK